jgi:hypothetical protein
MGIMLRQSQDCQEGSLPFSVTGETQGVSLSPSESLEFRDPGDSGSLYTPESLETRDEGDEGEFPCLYSSGLKPSSSYTPL